MSKHGDLRIGDNSQANLVAAEALRKLRKARRLSIETVAAEAQITAATLSRIEGGLIKQPEASTLEKLRVVLDAAAVLPFAEWKPILNGFGYKGSSGLPSQTDIKHAVKGWSDSLKQFPLPAYLVDHAQRVHDWNDVALMFMGLSRDCNDLKDLTLFDLAFGSRFQGNFQIVERDEFILHMMTVMKSEFMPLMTEDWCLQCINEGKSKYPEMKRVWDSIPNDLPLSSVRTMGPLRLLFGELGQVQFDLVGTDLATDPRFRVIQYIPSNEETSQKCFAYFSANAA